MRSLITLITACCTIGITIAQTNIPGGEVSGTWATSGSPYQIEGDIEIPKDAKLEIEPGVVVLFIGHHGINVQGCLLAQGNATDSIKFTVDDTTGFNDTEISNGGWDGIRFVNTASNQDSSKFSYCKFEYGKAVENSFPSRAGGVLKIENFDKVILSNSTFRNNLAGGGDFSEGGAIFLSSADIIMENNLIEKNQAKLGGGVRLLNSNPQFSNNLIHNNQADEGGGIAMFGSSPKFQGDIISGNKAVNLGGGIFAVDAIDTLEFQDVEFSNNTSNWGGGLGLANCKLSLQNCSFVDNTVQWLGAAYAADYCVLQVKESTFSRDTSRDSGGAIHLDHSDAYISNSSFFFNGAINGGVINSVFSNIVLNNCTMENNAADNEGGVLKIYNSDMIIQDCILKMNASNNRGGGLVYDADTSQYQNSYNLDIVNTSFSQNTALIGSGGMVIRKAEDEKVEVKVKMYQVDIRNNVADVNAAAQLVNLKNLYIANSLIADNISHIRTSGLSISNCNGIIENTIFSGNVSQGGTAACAIGNVSSMHVMNCLFTNNTSGLASAFSLRRGASASLTNCIFWNNAQNQIALVSPSDSLSCMLTIDYNLVQNGQDSIQQDVFSVVNWGENNLHADPAFVDESNQDFHLRDSSPCIGKGIEAIVLEDTTLTILASDFEGNPRPNPVGTRPDLGPFESPLGFSTSLQEVDSGVNKMKIFPNPALDILTLDVSPELPDLVNFQIFSMNGKKVLDRNVSEVSRNGSQIHYSIRQLPAGMYLIKVLIGKQVSTKKFVVVK